MPAISTLPTESLPNYTRPGIYLKDGTIVANEATVEMARLAAEAWAVGGLEYQRQRAAYHTECKPWSDQRMRRNKAKAAGLAFKEPEITRPEHSFEGFVAIPDKFPDGHVWTIKELYDLTKDGDGNSHVVGLIAWYIVGQGTQPVSLGRRAIKLLLE